MAAIALHRITSRRAIATRRATTGLITADTTGITVITGAGITRLESIVTSMSAIRITGATIAIIAMTIGDSRG